MNRYMVTRNIPGLARLSAHDLRAVSARSCEVLAGMSGRAQWLESFVSDDVLFCHYLAEGEEELREHARGGGFPIDGVYLVHRTMDPTTANAAGVEA